MSSPRRTFLLVAAALLSLAAAAHAQVTTGTIVGTVRDPQGGGVPGATVTLTDQGKGTSQTVATDAQGSYIAPFLIHMVETMHAAPGVGLAANQVGVPLQVAVIELGDHEGAGPHRSLVVLINPEMVSMEGSVIADEGCLSVPDYTERVKRAVKVRVRAQDRQGRPFELEAEGLMAKALQHEIDHLNGILFLDRLSPIKKSIFRRKLKKALAETA